MTKKKMPSEHQSIPPKAAPTGNSFNSAASFKFAAQTLHYHSLPALAIQTGRDLRKLPRSLRVLLENQLRLEDGDVVLKKDIQAVLDWSPRVSSTYEIQFTPGRVLLQDFTGVPVIADLAAMRTSLEQSHGAGAKINPLQQVDLVIDHSVQVDAFASEKAFAINANYDFERNRERYEFLKWGQQAFKNFNVVPPATGICHQVNLEYLAHVAMRSDVADKTWVYPDTLVGTDSHTPMVNGLGVLGWGVGGIEAEAAMLGQPCSMLIPDVVGVELSGKLAAGVTATDLVLTITQFLRKKGVVGKFVEFIGSGVAALSIANRATISNMAPEYGATIGYWPVDEKTVEYLNLTGRDERARLTEAYYKQQEMWAVSDVGPEFSELYLIDLSTIEASIAGPAKPHDRSPLSKASESFHRFLKEQKPVPKVVALTTEKTAPKPTTFDLEEGKIVIAAITSCTNTSNPVLMIGAALLARNAVQRGLRVPSWVKTSFAPGSKAVTGYLHDAGLTSQLDALGFQLVGYGCTTCIGNSGPLPPAIADEIEERGLTVAAVLSGNRNFEARIHPLVRANYLCSPPLVIAFALAGRIDIDLTHEALGVSNTGAPVYLKDIWPDEREIDSLISQHVTPEQFVKSYGDVFHGDEQWRSLTIEQGSSFAWNQDSTYIRKPPFLDPEFVNAKGAFGSIENARLLALFGDFITTDHISPAGSIGRHTPAGEYLSSLGIEREDFNSYGSRRGNHEVMMRGTFANVRLRNQLVSREGGFTRYWPSGEEMPIYTAAKKYLQNKTPLIIIAGREYGSGSSRDWAAKGTRLLGVRAVVAESFERIHRSNLIGMGVLPLEFAKGADLDLRGDEEFSIDGLEELQPKSHLSLRIQRSGQTLKTVALIARVDTANELRYIAAGGILPYVLQRLKS